MPPMPSSAMTANQASMIGPNTRPIFSVPNGCTRNSAISTATAIGST